MLTGGIGRGSGESRVGMAVPFAEAGARAGVEACTGGAAMHDLRLAMARTGVAVSAASGACVAWPLLASWTRAAPVCCAQVLSLPTSRPLSAPTSRVRERGALSRSLPMPSTSLSLPLVSWELDRLPASVSPLC